MTSRAMVTGVLWVLAVLCIMSGCGGGGTVASGPENFAATVREAGTVDIVTGTVQGSIVDVRGGGGIAGAQVAIGGVTATTGADGSFVLSGVPTGAQPIAIAADGYQVLGNVFKVEVGDSGDLLGNIVMTNTGDLAAPVAPVL